MTHQAKTLIEYAIIFILLLGLAIAGSLLMGCVHPDHMFDFLTVPENSVKKIDLKQKAREQKARERAEQLCHKYTQAIMDICNSTGVEVTKSTVGDTEIMKCTEVCTALGNYESTTYIRKPGECWEESSTIVTKGICP